MPKKQASVEFLQYRTVDGEVCAEVRYIGSNIALSFDIYGGVRDRRKPNETHWNGRDLFVSDPIFMLMREEAKKRLIRYSKTGQGTLPTGG